MKNENYLGKEIPKLGFGFMRLPKKNDHIDIEQTKQMVDEFMNAGLKYFDTAYVYGDGDSEKAIRETLVNRYPREDFKLATKLNASMGCHDEKSAKQQFFTSLERTNAKYFDFYLLHAIQENNYKKYDEYHLWDFVKDLKKQGLIKHWGFSFHASPELLDRLLTEHPDVEFVQLQINYKDWEDEKVKARENYEVARKHNKPIIIMEPVKGGSLANPPKEIETILTEVNKDSSPASWAIRYAASLDGVITVLSGMSDLNQLRDNISYMKKFIPLSQEERKVINKAQKIYGEVKSIPCTKCHYCTEGCPQSIPIPDIFAARNKQLLWGNIDEGKQDYLFVTRNNSKASDCIKCGNCNNSCPQRMDVINYIKECAKVFDI